MATRSNLRRDKPVEAGERLERRRMKDPGGSPS